jgi:hypothetical protein
MMFSNNAFSFFVVLAAAFNPVTAAKETKLKLSDHPELRGGSPAPVESLADADSRMLWVDYPVANPDAKGTWVGDWTGADQAGLAVQAGAALVFTAPATTISSGDVCAYSAITGLKYTDYVLGGGAIFINGCNPGAAIVGFEGYNLDGLLEHALEISQAISPNEAALQLVSGAMGGMTFLHGAYKATSLTVASGSIVTLKGNADAKFLFLSDTTMVTNAGTLFVLEKDDEGNGPPQAKNILFVSGQAAITGAGSVLEGSILSGAAITLGAASKVSGAVFAKLAIGVGAASQINTKSVTTDVTSDLPVHTIHNVLHSGLPAGLAQPVTTTI